MICGSVLGAVGTSGWTDEHRVSESFHSSKEARMFHNPVAILLESG